MDLRKLRRFEYQSRDGERERKRETDKFVFLIGGSSEYGRGPLLSLPLSLSRSVLFSFSLEFVLSIHPSRYYSEVLLPCETRREARLG